MLAGDDLDQQFAADLARRVIERAQFLRLLGFQIRRVIGMIEGKALDRVVDRPFDEPAPTSWLNSKRKRPRARLLHRPADPETVLGRIEHRLAAIGVVEQHAEARRALGDLGGRRDGQPLEVADALARRSDAGRRSPPAAGDGRWRGQRAGRLRRAASSPNGRD